MSKDFSEKQASAGSVKSAERALAVVEHVALAGPQTFAELLSALRLPRSSTHALLQTLVTGGWLEKGPGRRFELGLRAWEVGQRYGGHREIVDLARPRMDWLRGCVGETVQLARLDGVDNIYIAISDSPHPMRLASSVGVRLPAHATGIGKALLAQLSVEELHHRLVGRELTRMTARTITDVTELEALVARVRQFGYGTDDEEYLVGCVCVAVPLGRDPRQGGSPTALSITVPTSRRPDQWPEAYLEPLREVADEVRRAAGLLL